VVTRTSKDLIVTGIIVVAIVLIVLARSCVERRQEAPHEAKEPYSGVASLPPRVSAQGLGLHGG
jgi:hypothetical protein